MTSKAQVSDKILKHLRDKHNDQSIGEESDLEDIGEDCDFSLMFELCRIFSTDERCDGSEIGKCAQVWSAIDAVWETI
tara:strand:+ start:773 stop:1006 length:234 start_codon:yes stop_codon:yes gene_type:complete